MEVATSLCCSLSGLNHIEQTTTPRVSPETRNAAKADETEGHNRAQQQYDAGGHQPDARKQVLSLGHAETMATRLAVYLWTAAIGDSQAFHHGPDATAHGHLHGAEGRRGAAAGHNSCFPELSIGPARACAQVRVMRTQREIKPRGLARQRVCV